MSFQILLLIILACLILLLSILLFTRIRREKRLSSLLDDLIRKEYDEFLTSNVNEGTISKVARLFSDILINSFKCRYIIFIRKKKGQLVLNYYHGISAFNRSDFTLNLNREILDKIKLTIFPRNIMEIERLLPGKFVDKLKSFNMDLFFPIQWKDNLYGIYFIKSTRSTRHQAFNFLITTIAQSLSAAYHIKWHESKADMLKEKLTQADQIQVRTTEAGESVTRILNLIKHRKTDTIIPKLLESIKKSLNIDGLALIFQGNNDQDIHIIKENVSTTLEIPTIEQFNLLLDSIDDNEYVDLSKTYNGLNSQEEYFKNFQLKGFDFATTLPLSKNKRGLLVWKGKSKHENISNRLNIFRSISSNLVENAEEFQNIESLSFTDNLTGLSNQRYFMKRLEEEINRANRFKRKLALVIFDVDELKYINDNFGHLAGNSLLSTIGELLRSSIRTIDVVSRYGGDEFCIVMPESDHRNCSIFMERLQNRIADHEFELEGVDKPYKCTVSLGGAVYPDNASDPISLIKVADNALLEAKNAGRNCCKIASPTVIEN